MISKLTAPSSTIKAATLAGLLVAVFWGTINEFTDIQVSAQYVSLTVTVVSGLVGYFKKENVLHSNRIN